MVGMFGQKVSLAQAKGPDVELIVKGQMRTDLYLLTSLGRTPADLTIGTFCHENGHLLCRFPDMYDYGERDGDSLKSAGIGS